MGFSALRFSVLLQFLWVMPAMSSDSSSGASPSYCGGVAIPYPFVLQEAESAPPRNDFSVFCGGWNRVPKLAVVKPLDLQILNITLDGFVHIAAGAIAQHCTSDPSWGNVTGSSSWIDIEGTHFAFSHERNKFTVIGCDALSIIQLPGSLKYLSGCATFCGDAGPLEGSCSGVGCCQAAIPPGLGSFNLTFQSIQGPKSGGGGGNASSACSRAFLVRDDQLKNFTADDWGKNPRFPLVLEWVIGNGTCKEASSSRGSNFACRNINTECYNSSAGIGYRCRCRDGYQGNPYLPEGCKEFPECDDTRAHDCVAEARCIEDEVGGYRCACREGAGGDGRKGGTGCGNRNDEEDPPTGKNVKRKEDILKVNIGVGAGIFCVVAVGGCLFIYSLLQKRRLINLKEVFFRQNGGLLLQRQLAALKESGIGGIRIFTTEAIQKATDNFNESRILGRGGQGTVYKGFLPDKRTVAIKKSRITDETQVEQFINEVIILSQINHRNVVKLLGCCLETQVPLLVYEFVPNGTLSDHIHDDEYPAAPAPPLTWAQRLRIAAETAEALAYLHSAACIPIIHRDVKTTNILLDEKFTAKVADFGASRSVPFDKTHITTLVKGTLGYLDPEYFETSQLTEKSDVYSFGVVLVELLTREKPVSSVRPVEERNLASHFITSLQKKQLRRVLEAKIVREVGIEHLGIVARLAVRCLSLKGPERPSMKEVAIELELARRFLVTEEQASPC